MRRLLKKILPKSLRPRLRKWLIGYDIHTYYFSQAGEDSILQALFSALYKLPISEYPGFFVDIGSYDPVKFSNTYFFYINGWRGINVDPRPGSKVQFDNIRPLDLNLELGISLNGGPLTYYFIEEHSTLNTFSRSYLEEHQLMKFVQQEISIETLRLSSLFDRYLKSGQRIDLLNIDTEGMDLEILQSNDWTRYRPVVIAVEIGPAVTLQEVLAHESAHFLHQNGYVPVSKNMVIRDVSTVIFIDEAVLNNAG